MPPRYSYWTIIAGGLPTAFRAAERDELLPTYARIREKQPDAEMKWFARGKLWDSPDAARRELDTRAGSPKRFVRPDREGGRPREERGDRPRDRGDHGGRRDARDGGPSGPRGAPGDRSGGPSGPRREGRGKDWRPGGEHRDPRQKYKDAKKAKNLDHRREKFARKHGEGRGAFKPRDERAWGKPGEPKREWSPSQPRPKRDWRDHPPREEGRHGDASRPRAPRHEERRTWDQKGPRKPFGDRPASPAGRPAARPKRFEQSPREGGKPEWRDRPPREGAKPPQWRDRPPREEWRGKPREGGKRAWTPAREGGKGDRKPARDRGLARNQGTEEPQPPPRPRDPDHEPRPSESPEPTPPPRPSEPGVPPPGPPERGGHRDERVGARGRLNKTKRRER